jgi:hypothetical protein
MEKKIKPEYLLEIDPEPSNDGGIGDAENRVMVSKALESLSPKLARTLKRRIMYDEPPEEIMKSEGIQDSSLYQRIRTALSDLYLFHSRDE